MLKWITDYIKYVNNRPQDFNEDIKNNVRQIEELLSRKNIYYKESDPIAFKKFARLFKHREGQWAGKPLELNLEQRYMVACLLGIKYYDAQKKKFLRYFTEFDLFVARKWGKDTFIVPLITWFSGFDKEPAAWVQILAENEKQSKRTYDIIRKEIERPPLSAVFKVIKTEKHIKCSLNDGRIEYLSGRTKGKDGSNPSVGVVNEAHEITNFNQYNAIKTGMGAREQPMMIVISSAGVTPESLYESLLERNRKILRKKKLGPNDRIFAMIYSIDDTDDYKDESCWIKANPAMYEGRPTLRFLREQYEAMKGDPVMLNTFIAKQLNRQIGAAIDYFDMIAIKNSMREIKREEFFDQYAIGGVDLAETTDLCNATALILTDYGKLLVLQTYFIAEQLLERNSRKDKQDYTSMTNLGTENEITSQLVIITPGAYVRKEYVTQWFCKLRDEYRVSFLKIGYDRAMAKEWLTNMQEYGFSLEKYYKDDDIVKRDYGLLTDVEQNGRTLSEPIKKIKSLFENGKLVFDRGNKLLPYCFYNLKLHQDAKNYLYPHKAKSTGHIDGAIGLFNAFVGYERAKELDEFKVALAKYFTI
jgi:phage terminase large subunit-like protein